MASSTRAYVVEQQQGGQKMPGGGTPSDSPIKVFRFLETDRHWFKVKDVERKKNNSKGNKLNTELEMHIHSLNKSSTDPNFY